MKATRSILLLVLCLTILGSVHIAVMAQNTAENALDNIKKHSDYALAYPGILPDNPLYALKMARDRVIEFLILDQIKKSEFYLLQADKRLSAGKILFGLGKEKAGEEIISKGEKYFNLAVRELKDSGKTDKNEVIDRMLRSAEKHEEEITILLTQTGNTRIKEGLNLSLSLVSDIKKRVLSLKIQENSREKTAQ